MLSVRKMGYHLFDDQQPVESAEEPSSDTAFLDVDTTANESQILALLNDSPQFHTRLKMLDDYMTVLNSKFSKIEKSTTAFLDVGQQVGFLSCFRLICFPFTLSPGI